jgi:hypothetical protein
MPPAKRAARRLHAIIAQVSSPFHRLYRSSFYLTARKQSSMPLRASSSVAGLTSGDALFRAFVVSAGAGASPSTSVDFAADLVLASSFMDKPSRARRLVTADGSGRESLWRE